MSASRCDAFCWSGERALYASFVRRSASASFSAKAIMSVSTLSPSSVMMTCKMCVKSWTSDVAFRTLSITDCTNRSG